MPQAARTVWEDTDPTPVGLRHIIEDLAKFLKGRSLGRERMRYVIRECKQLFSNADAGARLVCEHRLDPNKQEQYDAYFRLSDVWGNDTAWRCRLLSAVLESCSDTLLQEKEPSLILNEEVRMDIEFALEQLLACGWQG